MLPAQPLEEPETPNVLLLFSEITIFAQVEEAAYFFPKEPLYVVGSEVACDETLQADQRARQEDGSRCRVCGTVKCFFALLLIKCITNHIRLSYL